jgi:hypothetical protein
MPFLIVFYSAYIAVVLPAVFFGALMLFVYVAYLFISVVMYTTFLLFLSERPKEDIRLFVLLPLFPFFSFMIRVWSAVASLKEIVLNSHLDSSMAPWWVLKKTKF